jgi:hypothetical protein
MHTRCLAAARSGFVSATRAGVLVAATLASVQHTLAQRVLPIVNPGFEAINVALRPGEQTSGFSGMGVGQPEVPVVTRWSFPFQQGGNTPQTGVIVPGWRTAPGSVGALAGTLNPAVEFSGRAWMSGYSGSYIATAQASFTSQTVDARIEAGTTYTLSFLAGIGSNGSSYFPAVQLLAAPDLTTFARVGSPGVTLLGQMPFVSIGPEEFGEMRRYSFSVTTPAVLPPSLSSHFLAVAFVGSDGIPRVNFDDFRLEAVPTPSALALLTLWCTAFGGRTTRPRWRTGPA